MFGVTDLWTLSGGQNSYFIIIWGHVFAVYLYFSAYLTNAYYMTDMNVDDDDCSINMKVSSSLGITLLAIVIIIMRSFLECIEIFTALYITDGPQFAHYRLKLEWQTLFGRCMIWFTWLVIMRVVLFCVLERNFINWTY